MQEPDEMLRLNASWSTDQNSLAAVDCVGLWSSAPAASVLQSFNAQDAGIVGVGLGLVILGQPDRLGRLDTTERPDT